MNSSSTSLSINIPKTLQLSSSKDSGADIRTSSSAAAEVTSRGNEPLVPPRTPEWSPVGDASSNMNDGRTGKVGGGGLLRSRFFAAQQQVGAEALREVEDDGAASLALSRPEDSLHRGHEGAAPILTVSDVGAQAMNPLSHQTRAENSFLNEVAGQLEKYNTDGMLFNSPVEEEDDISKQMTGSATDEDMKSVSVADTMLYLEQFFHRQENTTDLRPGSKSNRIMPPNSEDEQELQGLAPPDRRGPGTSNRHLAAITANGVLQREELLVDDDDLAKISSPQSNSKTEQTIVLVVDGAAAGGLSLFSSSPSVSEEDQRFRSCVEDNDNLSNFDLAPAVSNVKHQKPRGHSRRRSAQEQNQLQGGRRRRLSTSRGGGGNSRSSAARGSGRDVNAASQHGHDRDPGRGKQLVHPYENSGSSRSSSASSRSRSRSSNFSDSRSGSQSGSSSSSGSTSGSSSSGGSSSSSQRSAQLHHGGRAARPGEGSGRGSFGDGAARSNRAPTAAAAGTGGLTEHHRFRLFPAQHQTPATHWEAVNYPYQSGNIRAATETGGLDSVQHKPLHSIGSKMRRSQINYNGQKARGRGRRKTSRKQPEDPLLTLFRKRFQFLLRFYQRASKRLDAICSALDKTETAAVAPKEVVTKGPRGVASEATKNHTEQPVPPRQSKTMHDKKRHDSSASATRLLPPEKLLPVGGGPNKRAATETKAPHSNGIARKVENEKHKLRNSVLNSEKEDATGKVEDDGSTTNLWEARDAAPTSSAALVKKDVKLQRALQRKARRKEKIRNEKQLQREQYQQQDGCKANEDYVDKSVVDSERAADTTASAGQGDPLKEQDAFPPAQFTGQAANGSGASAEPDVASARPKSGSGRTAKAKCAAKKRASGNAGTVLVETGLLDHNYQQPATAATTSTTLVTGTASSGAAAESSSATASVSTSTVSGTNATGVGAAPPAAAFAGTSSAKPKAKTARRRINFLTSDSSSSSDDAADLNPVAVSVPSRPAFSVSTAKPKAANTSSVSQSDHDAGNRTKGQDTAEAPQQRTPSSLHHNGSVPPKQRFRESAMQQMSIKRLNTMKSEVENEKRTTVVGTKYIYKTSKNATPTDQEAALHGISAMKQKKRKLKFFAKATKLSKKIWIPKASAIELRRKWNVNDFEAKGAAPRPPTLKKDRAVPWSSSKSTFTPLLSNWARRVLNVRGWVVTHLRRLRTESRAKLLPPNKIRRHVVPRSGRGGDQHKTDAQAQDDPTLLHEREKFCAQVEQLLDFLAAKAN
ncbi:unnamed protein product [Amoebophrya sp. A120]|nr:unnamed protein product [Amoebophrya sp. A120]|eukprot:GSA120T00010449001.1